MEEGKTFNVITHGGRTKEVRTYARKEGGETWFMRVSEHDTAEDGTFDDFWSRLGVNHAENEARYIPEIVNASLIKMVEPRTREVWSLHYTFGKLLSQRTFTILLDTHLFSPTSGIVISVPFNTASDKDLRNLEGSWGDHGKGGVGVRGRYAAVEWLHVNAAGKVEWRMATTSAPGGMIPGALAAGAIPGAIAKDVQHFMGWMSTDRAKNVVPPTSQSAISTALPIPTVTVHTPGGNSSQFPVEQEV